MQIFSIQDLLDILPTAYHTFGLLKNAIVGAIFSNIDKDLSGLISGNWALIFGLVGGLYLLWKLKSWIFGFVIDLVRR